jgi:hypothetical protein
MEQFSLSLWADAMEKLFSVKNMIYEIDDLMACFISLEYIKL